MYVNTFRIQALSYDACDTVSTLDTTSELGAQKDSRWP